MTTGWVERRRHGWRGAWREEDGRKRYTTTVPERAEASRLLYEREAAAGRTKPVRLSFTELANRFLAQHPATPGYRKRLETGLLGPRQLWGELRADAITPELVNRWLAATSYRAETKATYLRTLRQVFAFGIDNHLLLGNPAKRVRTPAIRRSDRLMPFESWEEVERVAAEAGPWAPFIILAVDTGARPGELIRLEHRHVDGNQCFLPGTKTRRAQRIVTLTPHGIHAYQQIPRKLGVRLVFHTGGGLPLDLNNWRHRVWRPALELAGLAYRSPYNMRHTFAYFSLRAGVPVSDVAVEMGHTSIKTTHDRYGHWSHEMGDRAAALRSRWADDHNTEKAA
jgi:integrase